MTKQEADFIGSMNMCDEISNEAYKKIICNCEVEEGECEDCISREQALKNLCDKCPMYDCVTGCSSYRYIEKMESVTPTRPHGEWLKPNKSYDWDIYRKCSQCNTHVDCYTKYKNHIIQKKRNFCPNCGADMKGESE